MEPAAGHKGYRIARRRSPTRPRVTSLQPLRG